MSDAAIKYRPDIDGLRTIAVVPVVLFHAGVPGVSGGYVGVDVFFVISGYLIGRILLGEISEKRFSLIGFYERRARRILPALFAMIAVVAAACALILMPADLETFAKSAVAAIAFASNLFLARGTDYFDPAAHFQPLLHTWSLAVEEQFYLLFPLFLIAVGRFLGRRWLVSIAALGLASFALGVWLTHADKTLAFYMLPSRAWELLIGSALATGAVPVLARWRNLEALAGVALIAVAIVAFDQTTAFPGWEALAPALGAALIIHAGEGGAAGAQRLIGSRPMAGVGKISYSLYLWHWPLIVLLQYALGRDFSGWERAGVIAASFAMAWLSWRYVERPFRKPKPFSRRAIFAGSAALSVIGAALAALVLLSDGLPARFPGAPPRTSEAVVAERKMIRAAWNSGSCMLGKDSNAAAWSPEACRLGGQGPKALLWGDSFAAQYVPGFKALEGQLPVTVYQYTRAGCLPAYAYVEDPGCTAFNDEAWKVIEKYGFRQVILAARWRRYDENFGVAPESVAPTVRRLQRMGVKVVLVGQSPEYHFDDPAFSHYRAMRAGYAGQSTARPVGDLAALNASLSRATPGVVFFDPLKAFCEGQMCRFADRDQLMVWDGGHFSPAGSRKAVAALIPLLKP